MPGCCAWLLSRAAHPDDGPAESERKRAVVPVSLTLGIVISANFANHPAGKLSGNGVGSACGAALCWWTLGYVLVTRRLPLWVVELLVTQARDAAARIVIVAIIIWKARGAIMEWSATIFVFLFAGALARYDLSAADAALRGDEAQRLPHGLR
eukprot:gene33964-18091_t